MSSGPPQSIPDWAPLTLVLVLAPLAYALTGFWARPVQLERQASLGTRHEPGHLVFAREELEALDPYPTITNVQIADCDDDGQPEVLACDPLIEGVVGYFTRPDGSRERRVLVRDLGGPPAHVTTADVDLDGDTDLVVSMLGNLFPDDGRLGSVLVLERDGAEYRRHEVLNGVRRVADARVGDLDGDGDMDLAVAVFGYAHGQVLWLENRGGFAFEPHELLSAPGTIHVPIADFDGDGDLDIAAVVTQNEEEVWGFENDGRGRFERRLLHFTINFDIGGAGLVADDLDSDGDVDLVLPVGDNLEQRYCYPQTYHGCLWLENRGGWEFEPHRIAELGGCYAAATGDLDGDGDRDVVLVSMYNDWTLPEASSAVWLENDGAAGFRTWRLATDPIHLITVGCGDLDGDGRDEVVAGGHHIMEPYDRLGGVTLWSTSSEPASQR